MIRIRWFCLWLRVSIWDSWQLASTEKPDQKSWSMLLSRDRSGRKETKCNAFKQTQWRGMETNNWSNLPLDIVRTAKAKLGSSGMSCQSWASADQKVSNFWNQSMIGLQSLQCKLKATFRIHCRQSNSWMTHQWSLCYKSVGKWLPVRGELQRSHSIEPHRTS